MTQYTITHNREFKKYKKPQRKKNYQNFNIRNNYIAFDIIYYSC